MPYFLIDCHRLSTIFFLNSGHIRSWLPTPFNNRLGKYQISVSTISLRVSVKPAFYEAHLLMFAVLEARYSNSRGDSASMKLAFATWASITNRMFLNEISHLFRPTIQTEYNILGSLIMNIILAEALLHKEQATCTTTDCICPLCLRTVTMSMTSQRTDIKFRSVSFTSRMILYRLHGRLCYEMYYNTLDIL